MVGYVVCDKYELKVREFRVYNGYYCGLCKTVGSRHGQVLRPGLSYDMSFLALMLAALTGPDSRISAEHCAAHHIRKKPVVRNSAVDYASDIMMLLGWANHADDEKDGDLSASDRILTPVWKKLRAEAGRVSKQLPDTARAIGGALRALDGLEAAGNASIDAAANTFADVMKAVFLGYFREFLPNGNVDEALIKTLSAFARSLGRWIYLIDAADDFYEDRKSGSYNVFAVRFGSDLKAAKNAAAGALYHDLAQASAAFDLMDVRENHGILENVIDSGLRKKTEEVLNYFGQPKPKAPKDTYRVID